MELGSSLLVRSKISVGISVVFALWHLGHFAQSPLHLSLTRSRQIKQTAGIPRGIWPPPSPALSYLTSLLKISSSSLLSSTVSKLFAPTVCCVFSALISLILSFLLDKSGKTTRPALLYLHTLLCSVTFHFLVRPSSKRSHESSHTTCPSGSSPSLTPQSILLGSESWREEKESKRT